MLSEKLLDDVKGYVKKHKSEITSGDDFTLKFLAQGEYNINYLIETQKSKIVFRINTASQLKLDNQIKYEYDALKFLSSSGVTPKPLFLDDSKSELPYGLLTMEFLEGEPLDYKTDLKKAAGIFGKIHSLKLPRTHNFIVEENIYSARIAEGTWLLENIWDSKFISKEVKDFFKAFLTWAEKNKDGESYFVKNKIHVVNNTEVNSSNFIIGKNNYLIDWEKPVISDPTQDLTQFLSPTTTRWKTEVVLSETEKLSFFTEYCKVANENGLNITVDEIKKRVSLYQPYLYLRALAWCAHAKVIYDDGTKDIQNEDIRNKINEFLQPDQLKAWLGEYFTV